MGKGWGTQQHELMRDEDICDHDFDDYEKGRRYDDESSYDYNPRHSYSTSSSSLRDSSGSYQPMLSNRPRKQPYEFYFYRVPHKTTKYLCLILATAILLFVLHLFRMAWISAKQVELGKPAEKVEQQAPVWESFEFLQRYYGGVRTLISKEKNVPEYPSDRSLSGANATLGIYPNNSTPLPQSIPFDPYLQYDSKAYVQEFGQKVECFLDDDATIHVPKVHYYQGVANGFPDAVMGSYDVLDLPNDICFDRFGRYGPYGYGYSVKRGGLGAGLHGEREGAETTWSSEDSIAKVDYSKIRWAQVQEQCRRRNVHRFRPDEDLKSNLFEAFGTKSHPRSFSNDTAGNVGNAAKGNSNVPRTAILIRVWWDMEYTPEDILYLRSLISELSLNTGGEYAVHFLVHVRDDNAQIWADKKIYDRILENALPAEFRGMGILWSERQMSLIYGGLHESFFNELPVHGVYRSTYMPVQYFAHQNPQYDYFWNWEMDLRYSGQWFNLVDKISSWTKSQPRKGLWERNGRFYVPSVHGSWEDFRQMVRVQTEMGTNHPSNMWSGLKHKGDGGFGVQPKHDVPVWGPLSPSDMLQGQEAVTPPTTAEQDKHTWGVGEDADLITLTPMFDPDGTTWTYSEDVTGYNTTGGLPPRRAAITTTARLSQRLLKTMHRETVLTRHTMFSEMWPASVALHHGYKAVYAPHPVYIDRKWPVKYLYSVFNGGRNGATGGARTSVFGDREHNFKGTTWFYDAGFAPNLWSRWLGFKVNGDGGEKAEMAGEGRMCLPGVLLHPVKGVRMGTEGGERVKEAEV